MSIDNEDVIKIFNKYIRENKFNEAEELLRESLKIRINNFDLMYKLAYLYETTILKCLPLALSYYKRCLDFTNNEDVKKDIYFKIDKLKKEIFILDYNEKPLVSIIVLAYNNLKYTKLCIESIYKNTSHINFELITVNNGSNDETKEYFNTLPNAKKINIVNNVRPADGFNAGIEAAEGKYTACVCNDIIYTQNWLDNLLKCIESDESIGFVSPGSNNIANYQIIESYYNSIEELYEFAKRYNVSDPRKWEERTRLLPCVLFCKSNLLKDIGGYDPRFYYGEFADDDISIRIRRLGYKLIYARDTFVHHAGSVTTQKDHIENNSLNISKGIFMNKYNMDNYLEISFNKEIVDAFNYKYQESINILGINTFCGGTPLQVKNRLKNIGVNKVKIINLTQNNKYEEDLKTVSDESYYCDLNCLKNYIYDKSFDFIIYETAIEKIEDFYNTINTLKNTLNKNGQFVFTINNEAHYENLFYINNYENSLYGNNYKKSYLNLNKVVNILLSQGFSNIKIRKLISMYNENIVNSLSKAVFPQDEEKFKSSIITYKFLISCEI